MAAKGFVLRWRTILARAIQPGREAKAVGPTFTNARLLQLRQVSLQCVFVEPIVLNTLFVLSNLKIIVCSTQIPNFDIRMAARSSCSVP